MFGNLHLRDGRVEFRWKRWRNKKRQEVSCCLMVLFSGMVLLGGGGIAEAGPTGGQVTSGAGTINYGGATTTINQKSQVITINWQTFSTARNETVDFNQPNSSSLAINYVVGGVPSVLQGALNAEGRVYILNSAGITFTGTSHVNVGALLATTAMTIDGDPTQKIDVKGSGSGKVINQGSIQVSNGGFAILAAPYVENTGFIKADLGTIALAGTNKFTLDLRGDGLINFVVPPEAVEKIKSDGTRVGVNNTGTLQARSGQVLISASVATQVVNAAVNMSGVVDASAFAPNGKGGSVLITSEGDINISGQVNAAGLGSGAGGQIITKAVGADNIAANAMMTAAAGAAAGNEGGQIEVSGHDVLLSGGIDPGAGGTLIIDPLNFTIKNGISGAGPDFIGEKKLEKILQNGVNFSASAANGIIVQDLTDNVLQGGGGDLTLNAGNAIVFNGVNDKIVTGSGNITMTAGAGGIGIAGGFGHTVSLVSGLPGLDHAGNIVLTTSAGGDIRVKTVTVSVDASGAGGQAALFLANAGGDFAATGLIDVEAVAKGPGAQTAIAQIDITAHDMLTLHGLRAFASASEQGGGGNLTALAGADLTARVVNDQGNASVQAVMGGHSGLRFNALADLSVDATNAIRISGRTLVAATGNVHSVSFARVNALADLDGGNINIAELDVHASGLANKVGSDLVHATANLAGDKVQIGGNAAVTAFGAAPKAGYVLAVENLDISGNAVNIGGDATARATANNANLGKSASATANLFVTVTHAGSIGTFLHGNASVGGDLTVNALALNGGGSRDADVRANLQVNARGIDVGGDVVVTANGQTLHVTGNQSSTPHATALANLTAGAGDLLIDGRFLLAAIASSQNRDSVVAKAKANMTAGGSVNIHGLVSVLANAVTDATHFFANRNGLGPPAGALASAGLVVNAGSDADLGKVLIHATGIDHGNLQADAFANAVITAHGDIDANSFDVAALADQTNALGNFTVNGSALAGVTLRALGGDVAVAGPIDVEASVLDHGANAGFAGAQLNVTAANAVGGADIFLGNVTLKASASNWGGGVGRALAVDNVTATGDVHAGNISVVTLANDHGAGAASALGLGNIQAGGSVAIGSLSDKAGADNAGGGAANAVASFVLDPGVVKIAGDVTLSADADNLAGNNALAVGWLDLSNVANVQVQGDISIIAHGTNLGGGVVNAQGNADLTGVNTLNLHDLTIDAVALNKGNGAGAKANAIFSASGGLSLSLHNLDLHADASSNGVGGASAQAIGLAREKAVSISGNVTANAVAVTGIHALRNADAFAGIGLFASSGNVTAGLIDAEALASDRGAGNARGHVNIDVVASGSEGGERVTIAGLTGNANANEQGVGAASAIADATLEAATIGIAGNATLAANALNKGAPAANHLGANASATLVFFGSCDCGAVDVNVGGNLSVTAHATNQGSGQVKSRGGLGVIGSGSLSAHDVIIDVAALNKGHGTGSAVATAALAPDAGVKISLHGINLQADASSQGVGGAQAIAQGILGGNNIDIAGAAIANAQAVTGVHALGDAHASAGFSFTAINIAVGGIDVAALASDHGAGDAIAKAQTDLLASSHVTVGSMSGKANAFDAGAGSARALATTLIVAPTLQVNGDIRVVDSALNLDGHGAGNMGASGDAELTLGGNGMNVQVGGDIVVGGGASNSGSGRVNAHAGFNFTHVGTLAAQGIAISDVAFNGSDGSGPVTAQAVFSAGADINLSLDGLSLGAVAIDRAGDGALASARGQITQPTVTIGSGIFIRANASNGPGGAGNALGVTNVEVNATAGGVTVGTIRSLAGARDGGAGNAVASGLVNVHVANALTDAVTIGSLFDLASASNRGAGQAKALSDVTLDPPGGAIQVGNLSLGAFATNHSGNGVGNIAASANADLTFAGARNIAVTGAMRIRSRASNSGSGKVVSKSNVAFGVASNIDLGGAVILTSALNAGGSGVTALARFVETNANVHLNVGVNGLDVEAFASSLGGGGASANALVDIVQNNLVVLGGIDVGARAENGAGGEGDAKAVANLQLSGVEGAATVAGNIDVFADASDQGAGRALATALTNISASAGEGAAGAITIGSLTDRADALNGGGGAAVARAVAGMDARNGTILVAGSASAAAHARNLLAASGSGVVASADAELNFANANNLTVQGVAGVEAVAVNSGSGGVNAQAHIGLAPTLRNVTLGGVSVQVDASNLKIGDAGPGARATAAFSWDNSAVHLAIGNQGIHVGAFAVANDGGGAVANALVAVQQENVLIGGDVTVTAAALSGSAGEGVGHDGQAQANLSLIASSGNVTVLGQTLVNAIAHDTGAGNAIATALVGIVASAGEGETGGHIALQSLFASASADDQGAGFARANAEARVNAPVIEIGGDVGVVALAHGAGLAGNLNRGASADAELYFGSSGTDSGVVTVRGDIAVVAHGINDGSGKVNAAAEFSFADIITLNLHDVTIDVAALNRGSGTGGAVATAEFAVGSSIALSLHSLNLQAAASSHGGDGAVALATANITQPEVSITGDITLGANEFNGAAGSAGEGAIACLSLTASSGSVTVGGHIDVGAVAHDAGGGNAIAVALVGIQASAGEGGHPANVTLGSLAVHANALNSGSGNAFAGALANIDPPATVHILGNASVIASALNRGAGADDGTAASANAQLHFTDFTTVTVDGNAAVGAHATNLGLGHVKANGIIDFGGAGNINLGGVQIDISARNAGSAPGSGSGANATALFQENNAAVNLTIGSGGINVQALASSHRGGGATANAHVSIIQDELVVNGGIAVGANAFNGSGGEGNAIGFATLRLQATAGNLTVDGAINVQALASDLGSGDAIAGAQTLILANAGPTGGITIGSLIETARADDFGGGTAKGQATAIFGANAGLPIDHVQVLGDLAVSATADNHTGFGCNNIGASADAILSFAAANDIEVGGLVALAAHGTNVGGAGQVNAHAGLAFASASNIDLGGVQIDVSSRRLGVTGAGSGAKATASFVMNNPAVNLSIGANGVGVQATASSAGGQGALANALVDITQDNLSIGGPVSVGARASNGAGGTGVARAIANLALHATTGDITVGAVGVRAVAMDGGAGNAVATALTNVLADSDGKVTAGPMFDFARAVNRGAGYAQSLAVTHIDAGGTVHLAGVAANASASNGPGAQGHAIGASANAALIFDHATKLTIDGTAGVFVFGRNAGASGVKAQGVIDFGSAQTINVGGVGIGVFARNLATGDNGSGAKASAVLVQNNAAVHMNIGGSGLNVIALASSQGRDGASANALVDIDQTGVSITGDILVKAKALGGLNVARQSKAHANLTLDAGAGSIALGGNVNVTATASSLGVHGALASALVGLTASRNVSVVGDLAIAAVASSHAGGNGALSAGVKGNAQLAVLAGGSATFRNSVAITAQEAGNRTLAGSAIAHGNINATRNVTVADDLLVQANALGGLAAANVAAHASLDLAAGRTLNLVNKADLAVNAHAVSSGTKAVTAVAYAHLQGNAIHEAVANGQGNIAITASALGIGHNIDDAVAVASFTADADVGGILFQNNLDVHAKAVDPGTGRMTALGFAAIDANSGITVDGDISLTGDLTGNGLVAGSLHLANVVELFQRFGSASLDVDAQHGDVSLGGVSVLANTKLTATGTPQAGNGMGSLGTAGAWADAHINAQTGDLTLDGPVHVGANLTDAGHGGSPIARAHLGASAGDNLAAGNVTINAQVTAPNAHNAFGLALGEFSASGNQLTIGHVGMNALVNAGAGASGNVGAVADLETDAHGGKVTIGNGLAMNANAVDLGTGAALAYANADIQGAAGVTLKGQTAITADLTTKTKGGGQADIDVGDNDFKTMNYGWASAGLTIDPHADIKTGAITVDADADLLATAGPYSGGARALLNLNAADGAVTIGGPLVVTADVVSHGKFGGNASGIASALIHGKEGVKLGNATVSGSASAQGGGLGQNAHALGSLKIKAETGNITAKSLTILADAIHSGSGGHGVVTAKALSSLDAVTGNVTITGDKTLALAQGQHVLSHATASADIVLHAGHDLAVTGGGLLAQAEALASLAQAPDKAGALIDVTAGSDIFLGGNVSALAVAIGSHSGQNATANIFAHAGTGGFGHMAIIGNVSAIASADPVNDHALASVTLIANQMLIIGANPVALAIAGGKSAFRKAHRTTGSKRNGASGTTAVARITINTDPGGLIVINDSSTGVIPSISNPNADALQAMPIYDQTFPSGSLMAIPLLVNGKPCGALGGPGAAKGAAACRQAPINISNVVDGP